MHASEAIATVCQHNADLIADALMSMPSYSRHHAMPLSSWLDTCKAIMCTHSCSNLASLSLWRRAAELQK